jgi:hypothetical protein
MVLQHVMLLSVCGVLVRCFSIGYEWATLHDFHLQLRLFFYILYKIFRRCIVHSTEASPSTSTYCTVVLLCFHIAPTLASIYFRVQQSIQAMSFFLSDHFISATNSKSISHNCWSTGQPHTQAYERTICFPAETRESKAKQLH